MFDAIFVAGNDAAPRFAVVDVLPLVVEIGRLGIDSGNRRAREPYWVAPRQAGGVGVGKTRHGSPGFAASGARPVIPVNASRPVGNNRWEIIATVTPDDNPVHVVYRLAPIDDAWKVWPSDGC